MMKLIYDADKTFTEAMVEFEHGENTLKLLSDEVKINKQSLFQDLKAISAWHFDLAAKNFKTAADKYTSAAMFSSRGSQDMLKKAADCRTFALTADNKAAMVSESPALIAA